MLGIFELIFLVAGIYLLITGKVPQKEFGYLFGKGKFEITPGYARLWGVLLMVPGPAVIFVVIISLILFGEQGLLVAILLEIVITVFVGICSLIIARKIRRPLDEVMQIPSVPVYQPVREPILYSTAQPQPVKPKKSYGLRLLIMTGLVITVCITTTMFTSTVGTIISSLVVGSRKTGDFMQDVFPFIFGVGISVLGTWGIVKLIKLLK